MAGYRGSNINPKKFERGQLKIFLVLLPLAIVMVIPIIYIFCHAFKPMDELFAFPPKIFVSKPTWDNFCEQRQDMSQVIVLHAERINHEISRNLHRYCNEHQRGIVDFHQQVLPLEFKLRERNAFKPMDELFAFPPKIFVSKPTWDNFRNLFKASQSSGIPMSRYVFNSSM